MAKRGRKPKPTALKKLEGNPGKRPLNELEPMPRVSMLRCPNWLEPEAKKEWRRLAPVLIDAGILTGADRILWTGLQGYEQSDQGSDAPCPGTEPAP